MQVSVQYFSLLQEKSGSKVSNNSSCNIVQAVPSSEKFGVVTLKGHLGLLNNYFRLILDDKSDNLFLSMV